MRVWKQKEPPKSTEPIVEKVTQENAGIPNCEVGSSKSASTPIGNKSDSEWTEVKRKKAFSSPESEYSPSPLLTFKNLRQVDEVEGKKSSHTEQNSNPKRLTKSQKKKLKASSGMSPHPQP